MYSQLQKLAIICNACFWATVIFQVWEKAGSIPESVRNTVVVLGISALIANLAAIGAGYYSRRKNPKHQPMKGWLKWVIGVSVLAELIWLGYNLL